MPVAAEAVKTKWGIDPAHSEVQFKVKHLVISTVTGNFRKFSGSVESETEDDFDNAKVQFSIEADSIDTNQADRDTHLKSADFFDATNHPTIDFSGTVKKAGDNYKLNGILTIRETSKNVELDVDFGGIAKDPWENIKAGFELTGKLNRKDFGLNWNTITEAGGVLVGEEVKLYVNVQVVKG